MCPYHSPPKHLLLVDDERLVLSTLTRDLQRAGFRVSSAESAAEAENLLVSGVHPDLAILDVRMSGNDGLYLAKRLHQLDHIPFIMFSAYSDAATVEQATLSGALAYLVKPLDIAQLLPTIETSLNRANELETLRGTRLQLQKALDDQRDISVAVGVTMVQLGLSRLDAFEHLRQLARSRRCKLAELAAEQLAELER